MMKEEKKEVNGCQPPKVPGAQDRPNKNKRIKNKAGEEPFGEHLAVFTEMGEFVERDGIELVPGHICRAAPD